MHLRVQQDVKTNWVLTGDGSPQSYFGIHIAIRVCACWNRKPFRTLRCPLRIKGVGLSNQADAFVLNPSLFLRRHSESAPVLKVV